MAWRVSLLYVDVDKVLNSFSATAAKPVLVTKCLLPLKKLQISGEDIRESCLSISRTLEMVRYRSITSLDRIAEDCSPHVG